MAFPLTHRMSAFVLLFYTAIVALPLLFMPTAASSASYSLDPEHTKVEFKVKHLVISTVSGRFKDFKGSFDFDKKKGKLTNVQVSIDLNSVNTENEKRDKHLKSSDFFYTEKHPNSSITIQEITGLKKSKIQNVQAEVSLRGIKKTVPAKLTYLGTVKDAWKNEKLIFTVESELNRKDFGVSWNKNLDSGGVMVSENVKILIDGQAYLKK